jgi:hypothetical protein
MVYDFWSVASTNLPARSRLYSLPPKGIGTAQVESLTSYVMRLANAHAVSPGTLVRQEIFPFLTIRPQRLSGVPLYSINGLGTHFTDWVNALQRLTLRGDLDGLTLLPWQNLLASEGSLRRYRMWCPLCYEDRRIENDGVYDSLLWMLSSVTACPAHAVPLEERCPRCKKRCLPLPARGIVGYCHHCNAWLGRSDGDLELPGEESQDLKSRVQVARDVGDLLSSRLFKEPPSLAYFQDNIRRAIEDWSGGNRLMLCRIAQINDKSLTEWLGASHLPSLSLLLRVARNLRMPLHRFVLEQIPVTDEVWIQAKEVFRTRQAELMAHRELSRREPNYPMTKGSMWALSLGERELAKVKVREAMEAALRMDIPRSIRDIFRSLGYRHCVMGRYWFPDLVVDIQAKRKRRFDGYEAALNRALREVPPPTVADVVHRLGINIQSLRSRRPELCARLSTRRADRRQFRRASMEEALKNALREEPISFPELASRLGCNANTLRVAHPQLHSRLNQRYLAHLSSERHKVEILYERETHLAIQDITSKGEYPSRNRVLAAMRKKCPSLTSVYFTGRAVRRVRETLACEQTEVST